jgi:hypothetical protein
VYCIICVKINYVGRSFLSMLPTSPRTKDKNLNYSYGFSVDNRRKIPCNDL